MKLNLLIIFLAFSTVSQAQDSSKWDINPSADIVSRYVWRGIDFGGSPSIQPSLTFQNGNLEFGFWGAYAVSGSYQEADLYISYSFLDELFSIGITDYFFPDMASIDQGYFNWNNNTGHVLEANLAFNGSSKFPIAIAANTFVYGADKAFSDSTWNLNDSVHQMNTKNGYSTYCEITYSFEVKKTTIDVFAGFNLNGVNFEDAILRGGEGFYLDGPGFTNIGLTASREIPVSGKFSLPVYSSLIVNPKRERIYMVFGFTL